MDAQVIRVALVGAGCQGVNLAKCIRENLRDVASLQLVCDIDEATAVKAKEDLHFQHYCMDFHEAVDRSDVDAVFIAIPPGLHRDAVVAAANGGKHVFCEKPLAVELAHADEMIAACQQANVLLMVGYLFRYGENRGTLRKLLLSEAIGRPICWRESLPLYGEVQEWLGNYKLGGGAIFEYSHSIDFACYTFGRPERVSAHLFHFMENSAWQTHDSYTCLIRFESGDVYHISGFGMLPPHTNPKVVRFGGSHRVYYENDVVGPKGAIYVGPDADEHVQMVLSIHVGSNRQESTTYPWYSWTGDLVDPTRLMLQDFFKSIRTGNFETRNSGQEGRQTLAVLQSCIQSSRTGNTVYVSDVQ